MGVANFEPLQPFFSMMAGAGSANSMERSENIYSVDMLDQKLAEAYPVMTAGKFSECLVLFKSLIYQSILTRCDSPDEVDQVTHVISVCREYLLGLILDTARRESNDPKRSLELACYFSQCKLESIHSQLAIRLAMSQAFKLKNFLTAGKFAKRLIESGVGGQVLSTATKILSVCEKSGVDAISLDYDDEAKFKIDGNDLTIIRGDCLQCGVCKTNYKVGGGICRVCEIGEVGQGSGLVML